MTLAELKRLDSLERELRRLRKALPEVLALKAANAQMTATIARLIGENDALRRNVEALKKGLQ